MQNYYPIYQESVTFSDYYFSGVGANVANSGGNDVKNIANGVGVVVGAHEATGLSFHITKVSKNVILDSRSTVNQYTTNLKVHSKATKSLFFISESIDTYNYMSGSLNRDEYTINTLENIFCTAPQFACIFIAYGVVNGFKGMVYRWAASPQGIATSNGINQLSDPGNWGVPKDFKPYLSE